MLSLRWFFGEEGTILRERNFQLLLIANILAPLGTGVLSPVLDSLIDPFGASPAEIGLMISFFLAPPIVVTPIAGVLADRFGRKPILVSSIMLFGVAGTAIAFTTSFQAALGLRFLQGVAFGGLTPIIITSIGDLYVGNKEATAQGVRFSCSGLAGTVFPILSGVLVVIAWQYPFLIYAIAIPISLLMLVWFEEPTARSPVTDGGTSRQQITALLVLLRQRQVFAMVIARGLPSVVWLGFITYNSLIVVRLMGGTPAQAGLLVAVGSFVYAIAASQAGRITNAFDSRIFPLILANIALTIGFIQVLVSPSVWIAMIGIAITGVGFGLTLSLYRSIITGLASEELRGGLVSIAEANGRLAGTVVPIAMGAVIGTMTPVVGFTLAVQIAGVAAAIVGGAGGIACMLVLKYSPPPTIPEVHA